MATKRQMKTIMMSPAVVGILVPVKVIAVRMPVAICMVDMTVPHTMKRIFLPPLQPEMPLSRHDPAAASCRNAVHIGVVDMRVPNITNRIFHAKASAATLERQQVHVHATSEGTPHMDEPAYISHKTRPRQRGRHGCTCMVHEGGLPVCRTPTRCLL